MRKPEQQLQNKVANWIRLRYPNLLWTISPAGLVRGANMAVQMKRMGYKNGTPDILIFEPRGIFHGLFVELKDKGGTVSDDQRKFIAQAMFLRYATAVCFSYEEAIGTVERYMAQEIFNHGKGGVNHEQNQGQGCGVCEPQGESRGCQSKGESQGRGAQGGGSESPF